MGKHAVILAGGRGKRLHPYTVTIPKPVVPVGAMPIIEIVLRQLAAHGFKHVDLALGHMSEIVRAVAGNGRRFGVRVRCFVEEHPLGTMGPLKQIPRLPETFLVMNADILTDLDYTALWQFHRSRRAVATVATYAKKTRLQLGTIECDRFGRITSFSEKPVVRHLVSMGIYVFQRHVLDYIPDGKQFGFDHLMAVLLRHRARVHAYRHNGQWLDIGIPEDYERAQSEFQRHMSRYLP